MCSKEADPLCVPRTTNTELPGFSGPKFASGYYKTVLTAQGERGGTLMRQAERHSGPEPATRVWPARTDHGGPGGNSALIGSFNSTPRAGAPGVRNSPARRHWVRRLGQLIADSSHLSH